MGGALGLAVLASVAAARTAAIAGSAIPDADGLTAGYRAAFVVGAAFATTAAALGAILLRPPPMAAEGDAMAPALH